MGHASYGVTADTLREEYLPSAEPFTPASRPSAAVVARMIERASAALNAALLAAGVDGTSLTEADHPISYAWLADTLSLEAAARVAETGALGLQAEAVTAWHEEFRRRLEHLQEQPQMVIPDATGLSSLVSSHVTELNLESSREESQDNTPIVAISDEP